MPFESDPRDEAVRRADGRSVRTQLGRLQDGEASRSYQRDLFARIQAHRRSAAERAAGYDVGALEQQDGFVVAVTGEVLVRSTDAAAAARVLEPAGYRAQAPVLRGRVTRFVRAGAGVPAANALARELRRQGTAASVNHVVPLGYVAKGEGGFEPTQVSADHRGPGAVPGTVAVAVVDTGAAAEVREDGWLVNVVRAGGETDPLYAPDGLLDFSAGHGQFTAGVVQQVCRRAAITMYRAVQSDGIGSELEIAEALLRAGDEGARVVNLSLGTHTVDDEPPVGLQVALEVLAEERPDVLVVAAAGNTGTSRPTWPAAFRSVVAVASVTPDLRPSAWSSRGSWVDCSAVGEGVVSTYVAGTESSEVDKVAPDTFPPGSFAVGTGTSFAAPQIAGSVADLLADSPGTTTRAALQEVLSRARGGRPVPRYGTAVSILPGTRSA